MATADDALQRNTGVIGFVNSIREWLGGFPLSILQLATRFATLPILGMISVIQIFVYPSAWPDHVLWGSILVFLLTRGPGYFSVDYLIERYFTEPR